MANYFTKFCFQLPLETEEERDWAEGWFEIVDNNDPVEFEGIDLKVEEDCLLVESDQSGVLEVAALIVKDWIEKHHPLESKVINAAYGKEGALELDAYTGESIYIDCNGMITSSEAFSLAVSNRSMRSRR